MSIVFIIKTSGDNISTIFSTIIPFLISCTDMEVCTVAIEMVPTGKKKKNYLTAYELPVFSMTSIL